MRMRGELVERQVQWSRGTGTVDTIIYTGRISRCMEREYYGRIRVGRGRV